MVFAYTTVIQAVKRATNAAAALAGDGTSLVAAEGASVKATTIISDRRCGDEVVAVRCMVAFGDASRLLQALQVLRHHVARDVPPCNAAATVTSAVTWGLLGLKPAGFRVGVW